MSIAQFLKDNGIDLTSSNNLPVEAPEEELVYDWNEEEKADNGKT